MAPHYNERNAMFLNDDASPVPPYNSHSVRPSPLSSRPMSPLLLPHTNPHAVSLRVLITMLAAFTSSLDFHSLDVPGVRNLFSTVIGHTMAGSKVCRKAAGAVSDISSSLPPPPLQAHPLRARVKRCARGPEGRARDAHPPCCVFTGARSWTDYMGISQDFRDALIGPSNPAFVVLQSG